MPMISDEDAALLEAIHKNGGAQGLELAFRAKALHDRLYHHKDIGASYQANIKAVFPDVTTPADYAAPHLARLDSVEKKFDEYLDAQKKEREDAAAAKAQTDFTSSWNQVVKDYELTDEGQEKLESLMRERRIADPEAAAALYFKQNPPPAAPIAPSAIAPQGWARDMGILHAPDDADSKLLVSNPDAWADKEAAAVLTEERRRAA